jgi:hypothetical protein
MFSEFNEIMAKFFSKAEIYGQCLDPNFVRFRSALNLIRHRAANRDFKMWSNPFMKLGRIFQNLSENKVEWEGEESFFMPPEITDVKIENQGVETKKYFISRCKN